MKRIIERKPVDRDKLLEALKKGYGIDDPTKIRGFAGAAFDIYNVDVTDDLWELMERDSALEPFLRECIEDFLYEDYGEVSRDEWVLNGDSKYLSSGEGMIGRYRCGGGEKSTVQCVEVMTGRSGAVIRMISESEMAAEPYRPKRRRK